jgi:hypothetical protein
VKLCRLCAEAWGWTATQTLAQPEELILDMLRDANLKDAIETARDKHGMDTVELIREYLRAYRTDDPVEDITYDRPPTIRF